MEDIRAYDEWENEIPFIEASENAEWEVQQELNEGLIVPTEQADFCKGVN